MRTYGHTVLGGQSFESLKRQRKPAGSGLKKTSFPSAVPTPERRGLGKLRLLLGQAVNRVDHLVNLTVQIVDFPLYRGLLLLGRCRMEPCE